jgi:hypothetical protein
MRCLCRQREHEGCSGRKSKAGSHAIINTTVTLVCFSKRTAWGRRHLPQPAETRRVTTESYEEGTVVSYRQNGTRDIHFTVEKFDKLHKQCRLQPRVTISTAVHEVKLLSCIYEDINYCLPKILVTYILMDINYQLLHQVPM